MTKEIPFQVDHLSNHPYRVECAKSFEQLAEAKALDDLAFGSHLGITMEELSEISKNGVVILLRDNKGKLVGESQVITAPISQHTKLSEDEAYNYGTAVHPELQNHGIAQILFKAQDVVALEAGKRRSTLTVRPENAQSLRSRFKAGYSIVDYDPNHYGPVEKDGARLIMEKHHVCPSDIFSSSTLTKNYQEGVIYGGSINALDFLISRNPSFLGIEVQTGDQVDFDAHKQILKVFDSQKYIGVGLLKPSETALLKSLLVFRRK